MEQASEKLEPRIYVACLAAYNEGMLHGAWIAVDDDPEPVWTAIRAMLEHSPIAGAEEHAIHDYEGFGGVEISEYAAIERVAQIAAFVRQRGELGALVLEYFDGDVQAAADALDERYLGVFSDLASCFQDLTEQTTSIPENLRHYIDYAAMARDAGLNGEIFTIETAHDQVHVFWSQ